ncbi:Bacteriophage protein [Sodalis praecaptivus]|uniref:Bacteriophage protein n=1 Tax=Sodalis praecaptivus TaxID=1239307 RepID=W0HVZ5_9GAMM|nr:recombination protein NinG [Sodalis praecaptivus]AHF77924.1 Bacteriophage protein [Sodalis praecaptivus]
MARRKCKECGIWFIPAYQNIQWCSPECGAKLAIKRRKKETQKAIAVLEKKRKQEEAARRDKLKVRKLSVKPLSYFAKLAQADFNTYIRERDAGLPCISCDRYHDGQYHAGHYRSTGANPELRFNEDNCHRQCSVCNNHLSGNIASYTPNLIAKIGLERFDRLMGPHDAVRYRREDYERIRALYRAKLKALKTSREDAA